MSPERQALLDSLLVERFTPWTNLRTELVDSPTQALRHRPDPEQAETDKKDQP